MTDKEKYPGYRKLIVRRAEKCENGEIDIAFSNFGVSFVIPQKNVKKYGLENLSEGDTVFIKGKNGNEEADLWGYNLIEDIRL